MQIHQRYILKEVQAEYNLAPNRFDSKGHAYFGIHKGMYGLKQAAILPNAHQLRDHLVKYGFEKIRHTGMSGHITRPLTFTPEIDDLGIKYFQEDDTNHQFSAMQDRHSITIDWSSDS